MEIVYLYELVSNHIIDEKVYYFGCIDCGFAYCLGAVRSSKELGNDYIQG